MYHWEGPCDMHNSYCMMIIKATDGIIPNNDNYKGVYFNDEYGLVEFEFPFPFISAFQKMIRICEENYRYNPIGVLDHRHDLKTSSKAENQNSKPTSQIFPNEHFNVIRFPAENPPPYKDNRGYSV